MDSTEILQEVKRHCIYMQQAQARIATQSDYFAGRVSVYEDILHLIGLYTGAAKHEKQKSPAAACPVWEKTVSEVFDDNEIKILQKMMGSLFMADILVGIFNALH